MSGGAPIQPQAAAPAAAHPQKACEPAAEDDDLLGGFSRAPAAASAHKQQPRSGPPNSTADPDIESLFGGRPASQHRAGASMIDFGDEAPAGAAHVFADPGDVDVEGEPEVSPPSSCLGNSHWARCSCLMCLVRRCQSTHSVETLHKSGNLSAGEQTLASESKPSWFSQTAACG